MKKLFYILTILLSLFSFTNTSFAYYTNEQFRTDIKSYIDYEKDRQMWQDWRQQDRDFTDNLNSRYSNINRQYDIDKAKEELQKQQDEYNKTTETIKQTQELIKQQNLLMVEQKKVADEKAVYDNTNAYCKSLALQYLNEGVTEDLASNCAKYGVVIKTTNQITTEEPKQKPAKGYKFFENVTDSKQEQVVEAEKDYGIFNDIVDRTPAKKKNITMTLDEILSASSSVDATDTTKLAPEKELPTQKSFYKRSLERLHSLFSWF